jgi:hypothetical protein
MSFKKSLIDYRCQIPDPRHPNGRRHPLGLILLIIILGIWSGYYGYRGLGTFVERHRRKLIQSFQISGATVPSYSTMSDGDDEHCQKSGCDPARGQRARERAPRKQSLPLLTVAMTT